MSNINAAVAQNVARLRLQRQMSASQVARLAGISKATLLSIELGRANPTLETLDRIGSALNVPLSDLIKQSAASAVDVRRADGDAQYSMDGMNIHPLATFYGADLVYVFTATVDSRGSVSVAHEGGSMESLLVLSGAVTAGPCDALVDLGAGDWIRFPADRPHSCRARGGLAKVLFVAARRRIPGIKFAHDESGASHVPPTEVAPLVEQSDPVR